MRILRPMLNSALVVIPWLWLPTTVHAQGELDELGRLFTDASQREKLEAIRHGAYVEDAEQKSSVSTVTVNGIMLRSDGDNVVWVNGRNSLDGGPVGGVRVYTNAVDSDDFRVPLRVDGKPVRIKPGQSWSDGTGAVMDNY